jgi:hypothetical protein
MTSEINIFGDPPTQSEIDRNLRADRRSLTTERRLHLAQAY